MDVNCVKGLTVKGAEDGDECLLSAPTLVGVEGG